MAETATNDIPAIRVRGLVNKFGARVVHDGLNMDLKRREVLGVVGGEGTGKSVLLTSSIGLKKPDAGTVEVFGKKVETLGTSTARLAEVRWGVLFQEGALFSSLTLAENIQVPLKEHLRM